MSLCWNPQAFRKVCVEGGVVGGILKIWIFDPKDFDFTQATSAPTSAATPYTAMAQSPAHLAGGGPGPYVYPIEFEKKKAEYTFSQEKGENCGKYEHQMEFYIKGLSHVVTQFNAALDEAGCCDCGIGMIVLLSSGKFLVMGENVVNGVELDFPLDGYYQDGSSGTSGKLIDDANGETIILKAEHNRKFFELQGLTSADINAFNAP